MFCSISENKLQTHSCGGNGNLQLLAREGTQKVERMS